MLGQRVFRSMRVSSTELQRLAQASNSSIPNPTLISHGMLCFPRGDAQEKRLSLYAGFSHRETGLWQAAAACRTFRRVFSLDRTALHCCFLVRLPSRQGRRAVGELLPIGPCFPGLHVRVLRSPCQAELSRHSHHPAVACVALDGTLCTPASPSVGIAWPFTLALRRTRGLGQCFPHRKGKVTGSQHTARALNREHWGTVPTPSP